ncbi:hypothetical protein BGY98DRAFT_959640 [Russula aff. rugulosa BPL654]|nr:hypothetical protein BGY98DRAFT_959640 [Russula aff. rugulosa BPL654]
MIPGPCPVAPFPAIIGPLLSCPNSEASGPPCLSTPPPLDSPAPATSLSHPLSHPYRCTLRVSLVMLQETQTQG